MPDNNTRNIKNINDLYYDDAYLQLNFKNAFKIFASHLAMGGAPIKAIQELLGYADISTTMRYAHLTKDTLQETIKILDNTICGNIQCQPSVNREPQLIQIPGAVAC